MFNHPILDVFIGLLFIYLLYSLFTSLIQESIAKWLSLRPRMLMKSIARMLEDDEQQHPGIVYYLNPFKNRELTRTFYNHPYIKYLGEGKKRPWPSYISADAFSKTLIYMLRNNDHIEQNVEEIRKKIDQNLNDHKKSITINDSEIKIPEDTLKNIQLLWNDANKDIDIFKTNLENWFNETQQRVVGWYTRQTKAILFILGFITAISFNIDTIAIYKILSTNSAARNEMVKLAQSYTESRQNELITGMASANDSVNLTSEAKEDKVLSDIDTLHARAVRLINEDISNINMYLGLGWHKNPQTRSLELSKYQPNKLLAIMGWVLTALAISLGSTFWFDLLKKILKMRSSGVNPDDKKENTGKG